MVKDTKTVTSNQPETGAWESEGGSLNEATTSALPAGIIAETTVQYRVGPYRYSSFEHALAEHHRQSSK